MPSAHISKIVVLESLTDRDRRTGKLLRDDIEAASVFHARGIPVDFRDTRTRTLFFDALAVVQREAEGEGAYPLIHIECHGSDDKKGLVFADGSVVAWGELKPVLTAINLATRCNLVVVVAACYGGYLGEIVGITDRAPCWALIGPTASALPGELLRGYGAFYQEFLTSLDGGKALGALNTHKLREGRFYFMPAGGFFRLAFAGYLSRYCTEEALEQRADELRRRLKASGSAALPGRGRLRRELRKQSKSAFEKYLRHFFMIDLYPENEDRFPIKFKDVQTSQAEFRPLDK